MKLEVEARRRVDKGGRRKYEEGEIGENERVVTEEVKMFMICEREELLTRRRELWYGRVSIVGMFLLREGKSHK